MESMSQSQTTRFITRLNRQTKEGEVSWVTNHRRNIPLSSSEVLVGNTYSAEVNSRELLLYRFQARSYYDEDAYHWIDGYRLEMIDDKGNSEWTFPGDNSIYDLYETVRFVTSNVGSFISDYIKDEKELPEDPFSNL